MCVRMERNSRKEKCTVYTDFLHVGVVCSHVDVNEVSVSSTPNGIITAGSRAHY